MRYEISGLLEAIPAPPPGASNPPRGVGGQAARRGGGGGGGPFFSVRFVDHGVTPSLFFVKIHFPPSANGRGAQMIRMESGCSPAFQRLSREPRAERRSGTSTCTTVRSLTQLAAFLPVLLSANTPRPRSRRVVQSGRWLLGRRCAGRAQGGGGRQGGSVFFHESRRGTLIWHAPREFAPRCEPHPARAKWGPVIRLRSGSRLAFQRLSRDVLKFILSIRLAATRFPVVPSGAKRCDVASSLTLPIRPRQSIFSCAALPEHVMQPKKHLHNVLACLGGTAQQQVDWLPPPRFITKSGSVDIPVLAQCSAEQHRGISSLHLLGGGSEARGVVPHQAAAFRRPAARRQRGEAWEAGCYDVSETRPCLQSLSCVTRPGHFLTSSSTMQAGAAWSTVEHRKASRSIPEQYGAPRSTTEHYGEGTVGEQDARWNVPAGKDEDEACARARARAR
eukprot:gene8663-biopygen19659